MTEISVSGYTIHLAIIFVALSTIIYFINFLKNKNFNYGRNFYYFSLFSITLSFFLLGYHFLTRDFRLSYVTSYSSSDLSILYTISAIWAGQEGSFLLWAFLSLLLGIFLIKYLKEDENLGMLIYNLQILGLLYLLLRQSPFVLLKNVPTDGKGLNPLLLNPWMAIHPPFMFLGYASFGIPFTFAILLALKKSFNEYYSKAYKWIIFSWVSMGAGIILGGFWAYETLGWGGYWGWDPVENASLIPWLLMTALIHGMILQKKYNTFYKSNFLLATFSFIFVLYGTFLTRSGVLQDFSVHSFVDLGITGALLIFLLFFLILSLGIFFFTLKHFPKSEPIDSFTSKKSIIIYGILLLIFSAFFVTLGTSSPIITKIFTEPSKVSNNFYINSHIPIAILLLLFLGIYPLIKNFKSNILILSIISGFLFSFISFLFGVKNPFHLIIVFLSFFSIILQYINYKFKNVFFLHLGAILFILGSLYSTGYDKQEKFKLIKGEVQKYKQYDLKFTDFIFPQNEKSYGEIEIKKGNRKYISKPKLWFNEKTNQIVANPDIHKRFFNDIYLSIEQYNPEKNEDISFQKNETKNIYGYNFIFKGFQISGMHSQGGSFEVNALFDLEKDGEKREIPLTFSLGQRQREVKLDDNIYISIEKIDATAGAVLVNLRKIDEKPFIIVSFMQIPLINLVWLSSILILFFGTVLLFRKP
jgi:cytochrome c-type biogenesis protein CcmF